MKVTPTFGLLPVCLLLASALCARQKAVTGKVTNEADGATSSVTGQESQDILAPNIRAALRNRISGVSVDAASGRPGASITLNVRSATVSSLAAGYGVTDEPLLPPGPQCCQNMAPCYLECEHKNSTISMFYKYQVAEPDGTMEKLHFISYSDNRSAGNVYSR
jgi:hypothetical protein